MSGTQAPTRRSLLATLALTAGLASLGLGLAVTVPLEPLLPERSGLGTLTIVVALAVAFFVTELGQALVEVRRQAYSFSLAGVPMVLGLLYVSPRELILARLFASVIAFLVQRSAPVKLAFNTASYLLDTVLVITLSHSFVGTAPGLSLQLAGWSYLSLAIVDLLMSNLVILVISINQGAVSWREAAEILLPAVVFVALNTAVGFIAAVLLNSGALGVTLLSAFLLLTGVGYRGYLVLRSRHQSLEVVQAFIELSERAGSAEALAERLLTQIRVLVRASRVELTLHHADGVDGVRISLDGSGALTFATRDWTGSDWLLDPLPEHNEALLLNRKSTDPAHRRWLGSHDVEDALIVPLARSGTKGTLVATDRLGDMTSFTGDDLALLQTLAGHLAVALHSRQLVQRLRYEATHDTLTGLPNRALLTERMQAALGRPADAGRATVLLLDLDRFKEVNDVLGHHVGDQLLQVVAVRLRALPVDGATVARLGGDEFAVLLPPSRDAEAEAVAMAQRIIEALSVPVDLSDVTVSTAASIGIAVEQGHTHTDLLRHADTAMYAAKAAGVAVTVYTPALDRGRGERLALLADLHLALERDELEVHYQPKLDLRGGVVTSVEALVRWTHPTLGPLSPDVFIPLAESTGLIEQLTHTVLGKALHQCRAWQDAGIDLAVAVNLSARNVNNTALPAQVAAALAESGVAAHQLTLEITESSVMGDPERTVPTLERLAATGVTLSLDDFGTGYSSLSYLHRLPVREVKIDKSFVLGLRSDATSHASNVLIRSIISLGRSLGLRIVAEGVETAEVMEHLEVLGCDVIQGYFIGRALRADEIEVGLAHWNSRPPRTVAVGG